MDDSADVVTLHSMDTNSISLLSAEASQISNVNLYSGHAEITRIFQVDIKKGQNRIDIQGLPLELQEDSLRVEGHGKATIHDVVVSRNVPETKAHSRLKYSHADDPLKRKLKEAKMELESTKQTRLALNSYLQSLNPKDVELEALEGVLDSYSNLARKINGRVLDTEKEIAELDHQVRLQQPQGNTPQNMTWQASITAYGEVEKEVTLILHYVVHNADWTPSYQIQADTQIGKNSIKFSYKASITQRTHESWDNVPLTLETATPTFGISAPRLLPWSLRIQTQQPIIIQQPMSMMPASYGGPMLIRTHSRSHSRSPRRRYSLASPRERSRSPSPPPVICYQPVHVSDKGNIMSTFRVPGLVNVPSDENMHNITIAQVELDSTMFWYSIPKVDTRVHIKAKIKNGSDYTFIPGQGKVYVDGSFISTTKIPPVSPQEVFECSLGVDPSIRITYHPKEKKAVQSGIYTKTTSEAFTQRITIRNTKSTAIENLKIIDCVPVSEDQRLEVKLVSPALPTPAGVSGSILKSKPGKQVPPFVQVSPNVIAQWDGTGDPHVDQSALGKDGMINWVVDLASQATVALVLQYEVGFPESLVVEGL